jgi:PHD/YefM family antitoxin component YafN of YafNO toxin-antitoxin module
MADPAKSPKKVCTEPEPVLITNNGRPQNIIINVSDLPVDGSVMLARELHGKACVRQLQRLSHQQGLDTMTLDEINAEIAAARAERRARG